MSGLASGDDPALTWIVVLVKDFETAKQRLGGAVPGEARRRLARENAGRALAAAKAAGRVVAVACGQEAVALARAYAEEVVEDGCEGQNPAAQAGIRRVLELGGKDVLLLSSDLPLVTAAALRELLARRGPPPLAIAAAAGGRGGTNALYLAPPDALPLHFGDRSLEKFELAAAERRVAFQRHESPALALDLDEPADLEQLARVAS